MIDLRNEINRISSELFSPQNWKCGLCFHARRIVEQPTLQLHTRPPLHCAVSQNVNVWRVDRLALIKKVKLLPSLSVKCHYSLKNMKCPDVKVWAGVYVPDGWWSLPWSSWLLLLRFIYFYFVFMTANNYTGVCHMVIAGVDHILLTSSIEGIIPVFDNNTHTE